MKLHYYIKLKLNKRNKRLFIQCLDIFIEHLLERLRLLAEPLRLRREVGLPLFERERDRDPLLFTEPLWLRFDRCERFERFERFD